VLEESRGELRARAERAEQGWTAALAGLGRQRQEPGAAEAEAAPKTPRRRRAGQAPE